MSTSKTDETAFDISTLNESELAEIITQNMVKTDTRIIESAENLRQKYYGKKVFLRGLIEFTSFCKNDCYYCGLRYSNKLADRYRLDSEQILSCCNEGYKLGFRSFVMQGGEDDFYDDKTLCKIIESIKIEYPDCALTLSFGEKSKESYKSYRLAGADRYLLRHETATDYHYSRLHPKSQTLSDRKKCLYDLKDLGFQVGAGFMVGSPFQTVENLAADLIFIREFEPEMVGIGPFIPHKDTPFKNSPHNDENDILYILRNAFENSSVHPLLNLTITMVALARLTLPKALLPATTALASISENGRELAITAGANVVMPNLSPADYRESYSIYDNKVYVGPEAAQNVKNLIQRLEGIGYEPSLTRGDHISRTI